MNKNPTTHYDDPHFGIQLPASELAKLDKFAKVNHVTRSRAVRYLLQTANFKAPMFTDAKGTK